MHDDAQALTDDHLKATAECSMLHKGVLPNTVGNVMRRTLGEVHLHLACAVLCLLNNIYCPIIIPICNSSTIYYL